MVAYLFRDFVEIEIIPRGQGILTIVAGFLCYYREPWYSTFAIIAGMIQLHRSQLTKLLRRVPFLRGAAVTIFLWNSPDIADGHFVLTRK
jgi:hypothetical protein